VPNPDEELKRLRFELTVARAGNQILHAEKLSYKARALVAEARLNNAELNASLKRPSDHLDRFFCHTARARLVNLFPNAKEVTESVGAFHAVNQHLMIDRSDPNVTAIVVGDGHSPRTGALIALSTNWNVWSVDPVLKTKYRGVSERLTLIDAKIEDSPGWNLPGKRVVIVAVHSHARLQDAVRKVRACARLDAVSIPCCVKQHVMYLDSEGDDTVVPVPPDVTYEDGAILSPERTVLVWKNIETKIRDQHALATALGIP